MDSDGVYHFNKLHRLEDSVVYEFRTANAVSGVRYERWSIPEAAAIASSCRRFGNRVYLSLRLWYSRNAKLLSSFIDHRRFFPRAKKSGVRTLVSGPFRGLRLTLLTRETVLRLFLHYAWLIPDPAAEVL
jgi:hypothetical protein